MRYPVVLALSVGLAACAAPQKAVAPVRPTLPARSTTLPTKGLEAVLGKGHALSNPCGAGWIDLGECEALTVRAHPYHLAPGVHNHGVAIALA